jgi:hypothetical protein
MRQLKIVRSATLSVNVSRKVCRYSSCFYLRFTHQLFFFFLRFGIGPCSVSPSAYDPCQGFVSGRNLVTLWNSFGVIRDTNITQTYHAYPLAIYSRFKVTLDGVAINRNVACPFLFFLLNRFILKFASFRFYITKIGLWERKAFMLIPYTAIQDMCLLLTPNTASLIAG